MKKTLFDRVKTILASIDLVKQHQDALYRMSRFVNDEAGRYNKEKFQQGYDAVHASLYEYELRRWRDVAMLALGLNDEQRREVQALAYKRFYDDGKHVAYLLDDLGQSPAQWYGTDKEMLREMLREMDGEHRPLREFANNEPLSS